MENLEDFKTVLEILVIITTLAQTFPPLAVLVGLGTIYFLVKDELDMEEDNEENEENKSEK